MTTGSTITLWPFQVQCTGAIERAWDRGVQRPVVVLPTAAGKTVTFSNVIERFLARNPGRRAVILAHTDELVSQAAAEVAGIAPHLSVGWVKAERNEVNADVVVASVQTLKNPARLAQLLNVGLIVIDECHRATAPTYVAILRHYGALPTGKDYKANGPGTVKVLGVTATLIRGDRAALNRVWQQVVFQRDTEFMIANGFLVHPYGKSIEIPRLDLRTIDQFAGEYPEGVLGSRLLATMAPEVAAKAYREHAADRSGVLFWPTVETATAAMHAMRREGFSCEIIHGGTDPDERRDIMAALRAGDVQTVANCMVLTEGTNIPRLSCAVIARATTNPGLYQQMVGRVLRLFKDPKTGQVKDSALILDLVGVGQQYTLDALIQLDEGKLARARDARLDDLGNEIPERDRKGRPVWRGPTVAVEFDPLGDSYRHGWLATKGGTKFLVCGYSYFVFLLPGDEPGTWSVAWCSRYIGNHARELDDMDLTYQLTEHTNLPLEDAVSAAQQLAATDMAAITGKAATPEHKIHPKGGWNMRQYSLAGNLGLVPGDILRKYPHINSGDMQRLIHIGNATNIIDRVTAHKLVDVSPLGEFEFKSHGLYVAQDDTHRYSIACVDDYQWELAVQALVVRDYGSHAIGQPTIAQSTHRSLQAAKDVAARFNALGDDYRPEDHEGRSRMDEAVRRVLNGSLDAVR